MSYESPIRLIYDQVQTEIENGLESEIFRAVQRIGIDVDKEELIKALAYDRDSYIRGYRDKNAEIVRCGKCEYGVKHKDVFDDTWIECQRHYLTMKRAPEWFCADGEKGE